jgi:hypothetical protein
VNFAPEYEKEIFCFCMCFESAFPMSSVGMVSVSDTNIPRYLLHREKNSEIKNVKMQKKAFHGLYIIGWK